MFFFLFILVLFVIGFIFYFSLYFKLLLFLLYSGVDYVIVKLFILILSFVLVIRGFLGIFIEDNFLILGYIYVLL